MILCPRNVFNTISKKSFYFIDSARNEHRNSDCFVCTILSHGEEGSVYGTNGKLPIADVFEPFNGHNCPGLVEKPKIFFIQVRKQ